jgi:hypothetical protein
LHIRIGRECSENTPTPPDDCIPPSRDTRELPHKTTATSAASLRDAYFFPRRSALLELKSMAASPLNVSTVGSGTTVNVKFGPKAE